MMDAELIDRVYAELRNKGKSDDEAFAAALAAEAKEIAEEKEKTSNGH